MPVIAPHKLDQLLPPSVRSHQPANTHLSGRPAKVGGGGAKTCFIPDEFDTYSATAKHGIPQMPAPWQIQARRTRWSGKE